MNYKNLMYNACGLYSVGSLFKECADSAVVRKHSALNQKNPPFFLRNHINKQRRELGLRNIPFYITENYTTCASIYDPPGMRSFILIDKNSFLKQQNRYDKAMLKGVINHELGHAYHKHLWQEAIAQITLGALCFFNKTRFFSMVATVASQVLSAPLIRFQERQADATCARISSPSELKGFIHLLQKDKEPKPSTLSSKVIDFFTNTHPHSEDRITFFKEELKKKA